ncbi:hypothetical protein DM02DRAFT_669829 [Periconia macrospinosa]|uniref:Uncharacterized protein n=1 Tax=Periconia macrospinosa TaxID=97972 RepID=A0A2V1DY79_9PLEO|nr:hypothetical protein DM02DRAFT_669829 [Periconia macrospinosa]
MPNATENPKVAWDGSLSIVRPTNAEIMARDDRILATTSSRKFKEVEEYLITLREAWIDYTQVGTYSHGILSARTTAGLARCVADHGRQLLINHIYGVGRYKLERPRAQFDHMDKYFTELHYMTDFASCPRYGSSMASEGLYPKMFEKQLQIAEFPMEEVRLAQPDPPTEQFSCLDHVILSEVQHGGITMQHIPSTNTLLSFVQEMYIRRAFPSESERVFLVVEMFGNHRYPKTLEKSED